ncbi:MAG: hypothetical protein LBB86_08560 [Oscillospiraceae bacterium]|jgi:hypothetical protein|nr:hypothetical protein [Oscillospiraceae bacterium]
MMFFGGNRVEEDLARIRHANLPDKYPDPGKAKSKGGLRFFRRRGAVSPSKERPEAKDSLAMIIAIFSLLLPYVAAFMGIMGLFVFMIAWFW